MCPALEIVRKASHPVSHPASHPGNNGISTIGQNGDWKFGTAPSFANCTFSGGSRHRSNTQWYAPPAAVVAHFLPQNKAQYIPPFGDAAQNHLSEMGAILKTLFNRWFYVEPPDFIDQNVHWYVWCCAVQGCWWLPAVVMLAYLTVYVRVCVLVICDRWFCIRSEIMRTQPLRWWWPHTTTLYASLHSPPPHL